jgi:hypothetical protein
MNFFNPNVIFEGSVQLENDPTQSNHAARKSWVEANAIMAIHTDSSLLAETTVVNGEKQLKLKSLAVTDVTVDSTETSLANWITNNYTNGNELQEGDMLILTNTSSARTETYIHNGGSAGTAADFTEIQGSDVSGSEVRSYFSASSGINYNSSTGAFTANQGQIRGFFSAGTGLGYDDANGVFSLSVDSDGISEGSTNLYFTDARAQGAISVSGAGLSYSSGAISLTADSDDISEGVSNLYFTQARSRGAISAASLSNDIQLLSFNSTSGALSVPLSGVFNEFSAGTGLAWDGGGTFSLSANTDNIQEAAEATNLYFTEARAQNAISVSGAGLSKTGGAISLTADTDDISEGSTNQYFTDARARAAVSEDSTVQNQLLSYNSSTGKFSVDLDDLRKEFANQSLTANTFLTLNHGLGKKFVHVSAYDSNDNLVMLDVQLTDSNNLKVKAGTNKTGMKIVISL